jgi:gliding-associated putative ABC transporter substrate-binding component GldG
MQKGLRQEDFTKGNQNVAVLLEGAFSSYYKNRVTPEMRQGLEQLGQPFVEQGKPTKMIVVSDGDIAKNALDPKNRRRPTPLPLGVNPFDGYQYANKDFLMNCLEYLIDSKGIIAARNKQIKLRPLDQERAYDEKLKWQFINLFLPLLFLLAFGLGYWFIRRARFAK